MTVSRLLPLSLSALALVVGSSASAQPLLQPVPQNWVTLSAQASAEVPQDMVTLSLVAIREGSDAATVQAQLRQALEAALAEARKAARPGQVDVRTGGFNLSPRYVNRPNAAPTISGWQGSAELVLEGRDIGAIGALAGKLPGLAVQRVEPGLSKEARERAEADVAAQAIARFQQRAADYAKLFGFASYSLREVTVGSGEVATPAPMVFQRKLMAAAAPAAGEAQPLAPGQTTVSVSVNGSIQLSPR